MKKILHLPIFLFILLFSCILIFTACDRPNPSDQTTDPFGTTSKLPDVTFEPVEAVGLRYTVNPDKKTCTVTGLGKCKDPIIVINEYIDGTTLEDVVKQEKTLNKEGKKYEMLAL
jgi:hypothetical protein